MIYNLRVVANRANLCETLEGIRPQIRELSVGRGDRAMWGIRCAFDGVLFWEAALGIYDDKLTK